MKHLDNARNMWGQFFNVWIPIFFSQLSLMAGSFFAAMMAGQHGEYDLAGVAVGINIWIPVLITSIGLFMGITPIISHLLGAGKVSDISSIIRQAIYLAITLACIALLGGFFILPPLLDGLGLEPEVQYITSRFLIFIGCGIIPTFVSITLRNAVDAHGYTRISFAIMLCGFVINILLNYCFIFGYGIFPEMGGIGTGIAIALSNTFNCLCFLSVFAYLSPFSRYHIFSEIERFRFTYWKEQLKIGIPIGVANFMETSLFAIVGLLITNYGTKIIAAHHAANNFYEVIFTLPLSVGIATTILCGFELGGNRSAHALRYARMGQIFSVLTAIFIFIVVYFNMYSIASLYTSSTEMIPLIASFFPYALGFIFADAAGTPIQGALRGYKDVNFVLRIAFFSYWAIGLSSGVYLANFTNLGPYGYWIGFINGLVVAAIFYNWRLVRLQKKFQ